MDARNHPSNDCLDVEWRISTARVPYPAAVAEMEARAAAIRAGEGRELVWLLEHPPLYTAGTSANPEELLAPARFPVYRTGRGGRYTYHGPGQRVGYLLIDLERRGRDVRRFVCSLEDWLISTLGELDISARRAPGRIGIWVDDEGREAKIGAIGVRVRKWVTLLGFSINIDPDLDHFGGIIPCGLAEFPVTSVRKLGSAATIQTLDAALRRGFPGFLSSLAAESRGLEATELSV